MSKLLSRSLSSWLFVLLLAGVPQLLAQEQSGLTPARAAAVDAALKAEMEKQQVVGLAVGVIEKGRIVFVRGYGFADREAKAPVTVETGFRWASCSKPLTAIAAMQLVEQGKLDLDADIRQYVPEFPDKGAKITCRQLLCHQGGIVHYTNGKVIRTNGKYDSPHPFKDVVVALDTFKESPLVCTPCEKCSYSTHGYILLSAVVERAGKQRFADQVQERICKVCGARSLQPDYQWEPIANRAVGYRKQGDQVVRSSDTDVSWKLGGGGFISNVEDFARFAAAVINGKLVSKNTESVMWQNQKTADGKSTPFGLGFQLRKDEDGRLWVMHSGAQEKTRTLMICYPREGRGLVVMSNSENADVSKFAAVLSTTLSAGK